MKKMPDDIRELDDRIKELKQKHELPELRERSPFVYASTVGFRLGIELLSGVIAGAVLGYFLDSLFNTKPLLLIIFLLFGGAAGFLNVYKFVKGSEKDNG